MSALLGDLVGGPLATRTSEGIAHVLRKAILAGILNPGQQLRERRLAEELQVSRTPIREALFTLHGEGLVDLAPRRCARVRAVTQSDIAQIYALRKLLEAHSARAAAENGDRAKITGIVEGPYPRMAPGLLRLLDLDPVLLATPWDRTVAEMTR